MRHPLVISQLFMLGAALLFALYSRYEKDEKLSWGLPVVLAAVMASQAFIFWRVKDHLPAKIMNELMMLDQGWLLAGLALIALVLLTLPALQLAFRDRMADYADSLPTFTIGLFAAFLIPAITDLLLLCVATQIICMASIVLEMRIGRRAHADRYMQGAIFNAILMLAALSLLYLSLGTTQLRGMQHALSSENPSLAVLGLALRLWIIALAMIVFAAPAWPWTSQLVQKGNLFSRYLVSIILPFVTLVAIQRYIATSFGFQSIEHAFRPLLRIGLPDFFQALGLGTMLLAAFFTVRGRLISRIVMWQSSAVAGFALMCLARFDNHGFVLALFSMVIAAPALLGIWSALRAGVPDDIRQISLTSPFLQGSVLLLMVVLAIGGFWPRMHYIQLQSTGSLLMFPVSLALLWPLFRAMREKAGARQPNLLANGVVGFYVLATALSIAANVLSEAKLVQSLEYVSNVTEETTPPPPQVKPEAGR